MSFISFFVRWEMMNEMQERGMEVPVGFDGHSRRSIQEFMSTINKIR